MKKNDINLFKAAGGERAKANKRSNFFYIVVAAIVISFLAVGVAAYFNIQLAGVNSEYQEKNRTLLSYQTTKANKKVKAASEDLLGIVANEEAAALHDDYVNSTSKIYPHATETEKMLIEQYILDANIEYSVNDPQKVDSFTPWDYKQIRADLVADDAETDIIEDKYFFYYALKGLEDAQKKSPGTNVWNGYYRGYMVIVFTGGTPGYGVSGIVEEFLSGEFVDDAILSLGDEGKDLNADSPFMSLDVVGESTAKYGYVISRDVTYNIILCPLKSVIERMFDVLETHSRDLQTDAGYSDAQKEYVSYYVESVEYETLTIEDGGSTDKVQPSLSFTLVLPKDADASAYMDGFDHSPFFDSGTSKTTDVGENSEYRTYEVKLLFVGEY